MSRAPLVSVVVPAYGHAGYIEACLASVHAQSHPQLELLVVDDASPDDTAARVEAMLASDFSRRFVRAELLRNPVNLGAHGAINRGIAAARGSHVALMNSDDLFHPERIATLVAAMAESGAELGFSLVEVLADPDSPAEVEPFFRLFSTRQLLAETRDPSLGFALLRENLAISTGNLLFSRALYDRVGPFLPLRYCHDWDFLLQALYWTEPVMVPQEHYRYRLHGANSFSGLGHLAGLEIEVVLRRFLRRGLAGAGPNPLFPCAENWPGVFEHFMAELGRGALLAAETGQPPLPTAAAASPWTLPFDPARGA